MFNKVLFCSFAVLFALVAAECPDACSGHGTCQPKDQCSCYKNWQGNDCSEGTCAFGIAHVDSPKGNLDGDSDGTLDTAINLVGSTVYNLGTYELFPATTTDGEGHFYMECSNKGLCDRATGLCTCFDGYEGTACRRASCPNDCSGHGTCESIKELGLFEWTLHPDYNGDGRQSYNLWDADITMGCSCDPGFFGADCSLRQCKYGIDPLYSSEDDGVVQIAMQAAAADLGGTYVLGFYTHNTTDSEGVLYNTASITAAMYASGTATASCDTLVAALYAATDEDGNTVSPTSLSGLACTALDSASTGQGIRFRVTFDASPGILSTLYYHDTASLTGTTTIDTSITYRAAATCIAYPVYESYWLSVDSGASEYGTYRLKFYDAFGEDYITERITAADYSAATTEDLCNSVISAFYALPNGVVSDMRCVVSAAANGGSLYHLTFNKNPGLLKPMEVYETSFTSSTITLGMGPTTGEWTTQTASKMTDSSSGAEFYIATLSNGGTAVTFANVGTSAPSTFVSASQMVRVYDRYLMVTASGATTVTLAYAYGGMDITSTSQMAMMFYSADSWTASSAFTTGVALTATPATLSASVGAYTMTPDVDVSPSVSVGDTIFVENQFFTVHHVLSNSPYTITVDRPFGGTAADPEAAASGVTFYVRSTVSSSGTYTYVTQCSSRGTCDYETGLCTCYKGYSNDNCDTQNALWA